MFNQIEHDCIKLLINVVKINFLFYFKDSVIFFNNNWLQLCSLDSQKKNKKIKNKINTFTKHALSVWVSGFTRAIEIATSVEVELWALRDRRFQICIAKNMQAVKVELDAKVVMVFEQSHSLPISYLLGQLQGWRLAITSGKLISVQINSQRIETLGNKILRALTVCLQSLLCCCILMILAKATASEAFFFWFLIRNTFITEKMKENYKTSLRRACCKKQGTSSI